VDGRRGLAALLGHVRAEAPCEATVPARLTAPRLGAGGNPSMRSRPDLARREPLMR
jgi:hypothetical protein